MSNETGAFPENTGAPNDLTCGRAPCHNIPDNIGSAQIAISVDSTGGTYFGNQIHSIKVSITGAPTIKNGFEVLALNASNQNIGTWQLVDASKTQIIAGISFPARRYVTHTSAGNHQTEWTVNWKAPATNVGRITFYASVLASNNDGTNSNDQVYTTSKSVTFGTASVNELAQNVHLDVFSTPYTEGVILKLNSDKVRNLKLQTLDLLGRVSSSEYWQVNNGDNIKKLNLPNSVTGIYLIQVIENENIISHKIFKQL